MRSLKLLSIVFAGLLLNSVTLSSSAEEDAYQLNYESDNIAPIREVDNSIQPNPLQPGERLYEVQPKENSSFGAELVFNGDFSQGLEGWEITRRWSTAEWRYGLGAGYPSITTGTFAGQTAVKFERRGYGGWYQIAEITQILDVDVSGTTVLDLGVDVYLAYQQLAAGGYYGTEYPAWILLEYLDAAGSKHTFVKAFYYWRRYEIKPYAMQIPQGTWYRYEIDLLTLDPEPKWIISVSLRTNGWDVETYMTNVSISMIRVPVITYELTYEGITAPSDSHVAMHYGNSVDFRQPISQVWAEFLEFDDDMYKAIARPDDLRATTRASREIDWQPVYEFPTRSSQQVFAFKLPRVPDELMVTWEGMLTYHRNPNGYEGTEENEVCHYGGMKIWNDATGEWEWIQEWPWYRGPFYSEWTVSGKFENPRDYIDKNGYLYVQVFGRGYVRGGYYRKWVDVHTDFIKVVLREVMIVDNTPPTSKMHRILPYYTGELPVSIDRLLSASASDDLSGVATVELWWRYSMDNGRIRPWSEWKLYGEGEFLPERGYWLWPPFEAQKYGYYEFYTIAVDRAGNREQPPELADARTRVARDRVSVAVILAEPSDVENFRSTKEMKITADIIPKYFDEVSYGALAISPIDVITDDGEWFKLSREWRYYGTKEWWQVWLHDRTKDFGEEAIEAAGIEQDTYDIIIVIFAGPSEQLVSILHENFWPIDDRMLEAYYGETDATDHLIVVSEFSNPICRGGDMTWAHEIGHAFDLPDLYPIGERWWWPWDFVGDVNNWGLMGYGARRMVHLCSWSKERLGWLKYRDFKSALVWIKSLPNLDYGSEVWRRWTNGWFDDEYFIFEARSRDSRYSRYDIDAPFRWWEGDTDGLVLYKHYDPWIGDSSLNFISNPNTGKGYFLPEDEYWLVPPFTHWLLPDHPGVLLSVLEDRIIEDAYEIKIHVREAWCWENRITARLSPSPLWWSTSGLTAPPLENYPWPDLDLHVYTYDGKHVGMNYLTGEYEIQIPNAIASGEFYNASEWISVPDNIEVFFIVSSRDVAAFLENQPVPLDNENGFYSLTLWYFDENMAGSGSDAENQIVYPGAEAFHAFEITRRPDGTYSVKIADGMDILSLEAWYEAIDGISDDLFVNNARQRKNALKNKFEALFKQIDEKDYEEAIDKLTDDILKKLDANGKADWVRRPTIVQEVKALIAKLRYELVVRQ
jgi:M6 family metalloprotease-like protein